MVKATPRSSADVTYLPWVAFSGAVAVLVALPFVLTPHNDPAIWLVPLPALLLALGGIRSEGDRPYALACLTLGIIMDALLLVFMLGEVFRDAVIGLLGGLLAATAPTALAAGAVPTAFALRGRLSCLLGVAGGIISAVGGLIGIFVLWRLVMFTSP